MSSPGDPFVRSVNGRSHLVGRLRAMYAPADVPRGLLVPNLLMTAVRRPRSWEHRRGWVRPRAALIVGALVLTAFGATIAPYLTDAWGRDPGLRHVLQDGLVSEVQLSQTVNGITVTVERAYADSNRIAIGYTVRAPATMGGQIGAGGRGVELRDAAGRTYASSFGFGETGPSSPFGAEVVVFENASPAATEPLRLYLTIREARGLTGTVAGPWEFTLLVPVVPARAASVTLVEQAGITAVARLTSTPSESRIEISVDDPSGAVWTSGQPRLEVDGRSYDPIWFRCSSDGACRTYVFAPETGRAGDSWFIHVDELHRLPRDGTGRPSAVLSGPWRVQLSPK